MGVNKKSDAPCQRMEMLLQEVASGRAMGFRKWYALAHAARCHGCGSFLKRLRVTVEVLKQSKSSQTDAAAIANLRAKIKDIAGK